MVKAYLWKKNNIEKVIGGLKYAKRISHITLYSGSSVTPGQVASVGVPSNLERDVKKNLEEAQETWNSVV